jgi:hypothetical protein
MGLTAVLLRPGRAFEMLCYESIPLICTLLHPIAVGDQGCSNIRKIRIRTRVREYSTNSSFRNWPKIRRIEFEFEFSFGNEFEYKSNFSQGRIFANIRSEFVYDNRSICESHPVCHHSVVQTVFDFL